MYVRLNIEEQIQNGSSLIGQVRVHNTKINHIHLRQLWGELTVN